MKAPFIGISRHRISIDGEGVTTLAAFHGCPLCCKYCLNAQCFDNEERFPSYSPEELYQKVGIDNLYFIATGGGVCFGGGEPLLRVDFIKAFRQLCGQDWKLTIETSLNVPAQHVEAIATIADDFIIDIKDTNPAIYHAYTGRNNALVMDNLSRLIQLKGTDHITIRIPLIPNYNTAADCNLSEQLIRQMGITHFDRFEYVIRETKPHLPECL